MVVPAASTNLCDTDIPFELANTPSFRVGSFSEYVRTQPGTLRSFHPFDSFAAIGARAAEITANVSRHAYGPETPIDRLLGMDALSVCIGVDPKNSLSTVHHVEHVMAVPYRYTKEFVHPVLRNGVVHHEPFYMHVCYPEIGLERDGNQKLLSRIGHRIRIARINLGRCFLRAYSMADFYRQAVEVFAEDIYVWCKAPPPNRPYRE